MIQPTWYHYGCSTAFFLRKHLCPKCKTLMIKQKHDRIVNSKSEEAKEYDYFLMDGFGLDGDVLVVSYTFDCPNCHVSYTPKELHQMEKARRKRFGSKKRNSIFSRAAGKRRKISRKAVNLWMLCLAALLIVINRIIPLPLLGWLEMYLVVIGIILIPGTLKRCKSANRHKEAE